MRGKAKWIVIGILVTFLSCGGGLNPEGLLKGNTGTLKIVAPFGTTSINEDGSFEIKGPSNVPFLIMVKDKWGRNVYLGYVIPDDLAEGPLTEFAYSGKFKIGAKSTAVALVALNPLFLGLDAKQKLVALKLIMSDPSFEKLVKEVENAVESHGTVDLSVNPDLYILAAEITKDIFEGYGLGMVKRGVTIDYEAPYFTSNNGNGIRFYNPTMVYYWAGSQDDYYLPEKDDHWLLPMLRIIDFSIWPPEFDLSPDPRETEWTDFPCQSAYQVITMYKGFNWAFDINIFNGQLTAERKALLANTWQGIKYVLALVMSVDGILPDGHVVVEGLDYILNPDAEDTYQDLMEAIKTYDVWQVIEGVIAIINLFKDPIKDYLFQNFGQTVSDSFLNGALEVLADIAGIATSVYDLTTQTIPFFYDLIEKPEKVFYWVQNCSIVEGKPLINYVKPTNPVIRKSVYVYGRFFGDTGDVLIYPEGASEPLNVNIAISMWTDNAVSFYMPNMAQGKYEIVIRKFADGETFESPRVPVKVVLPSSKGIGGGGGSGGGGCVFTGSDIGFLYPLTGLIAFLILLRRKFI